MIPIEPLHHDRRAQETGWHLKKEIQISHLITSVVVMVSVVVYVGAIERRLAVVESQLINQKERDTAQDVASQAAVNLVRADIQQLSTKMDRLLERALPAEPRLQH